MAPQERWEAGGFLPRLPESPEQLDLLLLTVAKARRVHQDGIHFQGLRYLDLTLAAYVGESVTIRYDPRDLAEIRVFHRDRSSAGPSARSWPGPTIGLKDIIRPAARAGVTCGSDLASAPSSSSVLLGRARGPPPASRRHRRRTPPRATAEALPP